MAAMDAAAAKNPNRNTQFSKTKLCRFNLLGICAKGLQCPFAHGSAELAPLPDLRCTKLCKQLLSTGSCTTPGCTYAHTKEELRIASRHQERLAGKDKSQNKKNGKGAGKAEKKQAPQIPGVQLPSKAQKDDIAAPPGLEGGWSPGTSGLTVESAYRALMQQRMEQPSVGAKDLEAYTKALTTLLSCVDAPPAFGSPGNMSSKAPAYIPMKVEFGDESTQLEGTSEEDSEVSALAEEVAANALEGFEEGFASSGNFGLEQDLDKEYYYDEMANALAMTHQPWGWNVWGSNGEGGWAGYPALPKGNLNIDQTSQDLWSYGSLATATQAEKFSKKPMKSVRSSSSTLCTLSEF